MRIDVHGFVGAGKWSSRCDFRIFQDCWCLSCISRFGHQYAPQNQKVFVLRLKTVGLMLTWPTSCHTVAQDGHEVGSTPWSRKYAVSKFFGVYSWCFPPCNLWHLCLLLTMPNLHLTMRNRWRNHQKACKLPLGRKMLLSIRIRVCKVMLVIYRFRLRPSWRSWDWSLSPCASAKNPAVPWAQPSFGTRQVAWATRILLQSGPMFVSWLWPWRESSPRLKAAVAPQAPRAASAKIGCLWIRCKGGVERTGRHMALPWWDWCD